jgi:hypothetical protein
LYGRDRERGGKQHQSLVAWCTVRDMAGTGYKSREQIDFSLVHHISLFGFILSIFSIFFSEK